MSRTIDPSVFTVVAAQTAIAAASQLQLVQLGLIEISQAAEQLRVLAKHVEAMNLPAQDVAELLADGLRSNAELLDKAAQQSAAGRPFTLTLVHSRSDPTG